MDPFFRPQQSEALVLIRRLNESMDLRFVHPQAELEGELVFTDSQGRHSTIVVSTDDKNSYPVFKLGDDRF